MLLDRVLGDVALDERRELFAVERPPDDEGPPAPGDGVVPRPRILGGLALAFLALGRRHWDALRAVASELVDVLGAVAVRHIYKRCLIHQSVQFQGCCLICLDHSRQ